MKPEMIDMYWAESTISFPVIGRRKKVAWRVREIPWTCERLGALAAGAKLLGLNEVARALGHQRRAARRKLQGPKARPRRINGRLRRKA